MHEGLRDRSGALIFAGIVEILIAGVFLLFVPLSLLVPSTSSGSGPATPADPRALAVSVGLYLALATFFAWAGIDTIRRRRWARTLMLSVAWLWLVVGIASLLFWLAILPSIGALLAAGGAGELPPEVLMVVKVLGTGLLAVVYVAVPAAFIGLLRSPSVRATVERHDPTVPWTDRVPGPVLSMILTLIYLGATGLLLAPYGGVPCFGIILGPVPSALVWVVVAALSGWLAYGFYRREIAAWWGTIALTVLGTVSAVVTFLRVDPMELWSAMGIGQDQLEMLRDTWIASTPGMIAISVLSGASIVGYAVWMRPHMTDRGTIAIDETPNPRHDSAR